MTISITHFNGSLPTIENLAPLAFAGYAHFTAMQVRGGAIRGLDLHLERLRAGSETLFGQHLPEERILGYVRAALKEVPADVSLTVFISSRPGEFMVGDSHVKLDVLIKITDPTSGPAGPLSLDLIEHERHLPGVKHVGEVSKTLYLRRAHTRGFHDAAFVDHRGNLSEATIWNISLWDGSSVIWPKADILPGVTMQILHRQLAARGVSQQTQTIDLATLGRPVSAAVMNSWNPGIPVTRISDHKLPSSVDFIKLLREAYEAEPLERP